MFTWLSILSLFLAISSSIPVLPGFIRFSDIILWYNFCTLNSVSCTNTYKFRAVPAQIQTNLRWFPLWFPAQIQTNSRRFPLWFPLVSNSGLFSPRYFVFNCILYKLLHCYLKLKISPVNKISFFFTNFAIWIRWSEVSILPDVLSLAPGSWLGPAQPSPDQPHPNQRYVYLDTLRLKKMSFCHILWFFNSNISETRCGRTFIFQTINSVRSSIRSLKYQRFAPSGCIDIGIRNFLFVVKTQFLY